MIRKPTVSQPKPIDTPRLDIENKWGVSVAERGFTQIPMYLMNLNRFLDTDHKLKPVEILVLYQLVGMWWKKEVNPYPSMRTLGEHLGISGRQIQRAISRLTDAKLINKISRTKKKGVITSNAYDMKPLVLLLNDVAKAFPTEYPRTLK